MLNKKLNEVEFVIFDVETTGLSPLNGDRIIEIAAKRYKSLQEVDSFQSLVNPERPVSYGAYLVNHISDEMLIDAPKSKAVLKKFYSFLKGSCLMGYNVNFDVGFLNNELSFINKSLPKNLPIVDILKISRATLPNLDHYSLLNVSYYLGVQESQMHRASEDVELTFGVFCKLLKMLESQGIVDFHNFVHMFGVNMELHALLSNVKLAQIQEAIDSGLSLQIKYFSASSGKSTQRKVTPKEIYKEDKKDFLKGFCHLRNEERSFRIDRILELQML
jgi:DNA polymerase III epsilon subunit family exonuclease